MQIYSHSGKRLGERSKSYMAEFSSNPDERLKSEVSYSEHKKREKHNDDKRNEYRIKVNQERDKNNLYTFKNQDEFEELIDNCNIEDDQKLFKYLTTYNSI